MKARHPIHRFGTYYLHGDGKPRQVAILDIDRDKGRVKVRDRASVYWIASEHLRRSAKPAPRPRSAPLVGFGRTGKAR